MATYSFQSSASMWKYHRIFERKKQISTGNENTSPRHAACKKVEMAKAGKTSPDSECGNATKRTRARETRWGSRPLLRSGSFMSGCDLARRTEQS